MYVLRTIDDRRHISTPTPPDLFRMPISRRPVESKRRATRLSMEKSGRHPPKAATATVIIHTVPEVIPGGIFFIVFFAHFYFPDSGQAVVTGDVVPYSPPVLAFDSYRA